ncbi:MAG TPA: hypothetical protein VFE78_28795 [Gemmataceae bacterium]|jgi:hypothetical protein|nr:hypothetical protein [Gemmataceae bacterium]
MCTGLAPGDCRAALEAAGWATSFCIVFYLHGSVWVARAVKDGLAVEGRGATAGEAWREDYAAALLPPAAGQPSGSSSSA